MRRRLIQQVPAALGGLIGKEVAQSGVYKLHEFMQSPVLLRSLLYVVARRCEPRRAAPSDSAAPVAATPSWTCCWCACFRRYASMVCGGTRATTVPASHGFEEQRVFTLLLQICVGAAPGSAVLAIGAAPGGAVPAIGDTTGSAVLAS